MIVPIDIKQVCISLLKITLEDIPGEKADEIVQIVISLLEMK